MDIELALYSFIENQEYLLKEKYLTIIKTQKEDKVTTRILPTEKFIKLINTEPPKKLVDKATLLMEFEAFYELIPVVKLPSNHYLRSTKSATKAKFLKFRSEFPEFDFELIVEVILAWIKEYEAKNWLYCHTISNFIYKDRGTESHLASWCQNYDDASSSSRSMNTFNPNIS